MREAALEGVKLDVFPLSCFTRADITARAYVETIVWPEMRHAVASHGRQAGMSDADIARAEQVLDPSSPTWVGADADTYVMQPTLLWTGRRRG